MLKNFTSLAVNLSKAFKWYCLKLEKRPILTRSCTAASIMMSGDLIAQYIESKTGGPTPCLLYYVKKPGEEVQCAIRDKTKGFYIDYSSIILENRTLTKSHSKMCSKNIFIGDLEHFPASKTL